MDNSRSLSPSQTKRLVLGIVLSVALLTAGSVWWGLSHPTPKSLQVLTPSRTPGGPATVKATISVEGMTCEGCAASINSALKEMGADSVAVNLEAKTAVVTFRTDKISVGEILSKIQELGYTPRLDG